MLCPKDIGKKVIDLEVGKMTSYQLNVNHKPLKLPVNACLE